MDNTTREKFLKLALVAFGGIFFVIYPLGMIWPSGWVWHGGEGIYYLQMICGAYFVLGIYLIKASGQNIPRKSSADNIQPSCGRFIK